MGLAHVGVLTASCSSTEPDLYLLEFEQEGLAVGFLTDEEMVATLDATLDEAFIVSGAAPLSACCTLKGDTRGSSLDDIALRVFVVAVEGSGACHQLNVYRSYRATIAKQGAGPWRIRVFRQDHASPRNDVLALDTVVARVDDD